MTPIRRTFIPPTHTEPPASNQVGLRRVAASEYDVDCARCTHTVGTLVTRLDQHSNLVPASEAAAAAASRASGSVRQVSGFSAPVTGVTSTPSPDSSIPDDDDEINYEPAGAGRPFDESRKEKEVVGLRAVNEGGYETL